MPKIDIQMNEFHVFKFLYALDWRIITVYVCDSLSLFMSDLTTIDFQFGFFRKFIACIVALMSSSFRFCPSFIYGGEVFQYSFLDCSSESQMCNIGIRNAREARK